MKMVAVHVHAAIALQTLLPACCDALIRIVRRLICGRYCQHQLEGGCVDRVVLREGEVDRQAGRGCNLSVED